MTHAAQVHESGGEKFLSVVEDQSIDYHYENGRTYSLRRGRYRIVDVDTNERGTAVSIVLKETRLSGESDVVAWVDGDEVNFDARYFCGCPVRIVTAEGHQEGCRVIEYEADVRSGRVFSLAAAGINSAIGYRPPIQLGTYSRTLRVLGQFSTEGLEAAVLAGRLLKAAGDLGLTEPQFFARLYSEASKAAAEGWFDVTGASGPDAGRRRDYEKVYSIRTLVRLQVVLSSVQRDGGVGWVWSVLADTYGVRREVI